MTFYAVSLTIWFGVQDYYGVFIVEIAAPLIATVKGIKSELIIHRGNDVIASFIYQGGGATHQVIDVLVKTSFYSFNAPLTFAVLSVFYPFLKLNPAFKREFPSNYGTYLFYLQVLGSLFIFHVVIVFFMLGKDLSVMLAGMEIATARFKVELWLFAGQFVEYIGKRVEPLLVGFYIFIRFFSFR
ncbi:MAG: hypothetical protein HQL06_02565 [Nitrospirae bacterium]|nr:hypothetical protein [Nitrospirota bacterium]